MVPAHRIAVVEDRPHLDRREDQLGDEGLRRPRPPLLEDRVLRQRDGAAVGERRASLDLLQAVETAVGDLDLAVVLALLGEDLEPDVDLEVGGDLRGVVQELELGPLEEHHGRGSGLPRHRVEGALGVADRREVAGRERAGEKSEEEDGDRESHIK